MNRNQRKYGQLNKDNHYQNIKQNSFIKDEVDEVFPPKHRRNLAKVEKLTNNRCCHVSPVQKDEALLTECADQYQDILKKQYGFEPLIPDTVNQIAELRKILCRPKVENGSQYVDPLECSSDSKVMDSEWQNVDDAEDIDKFIKGAEGKSLSVKNIQISDVPRVKVIAEKFYKYKKNNVELRKLDEKIVCVEYDVYDQDGADLDKPVQKMRAYFSIKPNNGNKDNDIPNLSSTVKRKFNVASDDLRQLNQKEIEIIDEKIAENKPYLSDLKHVLKRKLAIHAKKNKNSLDLEYLYDMAKRNNPLLDENYSHTNLLSKAELDEIKDIIIKKCTSSVHALSRRKVKCEIEKPVSDREGNIEAVSENIIMQLLTM